MVVVERFIPSIGNATTFGASYLDLAANARNLADSARETGLSGRSDAACSARIGAARVPTILTSKRAEEHLKTIVCRKQKSIQSSGDAVDGFVERADPEPINRGCRMSPNNAAVAAGAVGYVEDRAKGASRIDGAQRATPAGIEFQEQDRVQSTQANRPVGAEGARIHRSNFLAADVLRTPDRSPRSHARRAGDRATDREAGSRAAQRARPPAAPQGEGVALEPPARSQQRHREP